MKKTFAVLLTAVMLLALPASAPAYDGKITFQGIPWGSSIEGSLDILKEKGFVNGDVLDYILTNYSLEDIILPEYGTYLKAQKDMTAETTHENLAYLASLQIDGGSMLLPEDLKIAGYPVERYDLTFFSSGEESGLIFVEICLKYDDPKAAFEDLEAKLTSVYGKPVHKSPIYTLDTYAWKGTDGSLVFICSLGGGETFSFYYGTLGAEAMIAEAAANAPGSDAAVDSTDVGGL